ncbi:MAG: hypothetical protein Q4C83_02995 [Candidatus Saccharibacteria bacterium]|nr:hypothetical protein [Candidatus Saccharibacteria bacterium]
MAKRVSTWWKSLPNWIHKVSQAVAALAALLTALTASFSWFEDQVTANTNKRIDELSEKISEIEDDNALSLKRLELMTLIAHNPDNKAEIERVAYHYFVKLGGDWYMTRIYSEWADKYGGDISFVRELN